MGRVENQPRCLCLQQGRFFLRLDAPENEHNGLRQAVGGADHRVGEALPAPFGVAVGLAALDSQHRIQQQHALLCPGRQIAVIRRRQARVRLQFRVNIPQRRRQRHTSGHGKGQTKSLLRLVIGVLSQDHGPDRFRRRHFQREKFPSGGRIDLRRLPRFFHPVIQRRKIGLLQLLPEQGRPGPQPFEIHGLTSKKIIAHPEKNGNHFPYSLQEKTVV